MNVRTESYRTFDADKIIFSEIKKSTGGMYNVAIKYQYPDGVVDALRLQTPVLYARQGVKYWPPGQYDEQWVVDLSSDGVCLRDEPHPDPAFAGLTSQQFSGTDGNAVQFFRAIAALDNKAVEYCINTKDLFPNGSGKKMSKEVMLSKYNKSIKGEANSMYPPKVSLKIPVYDTAKKGDAPTGLKRFDTTFWNQQKEEVSLESLLDKESNVIAIIYIPKIYFTPTLMFGCKLTPNDVTIVKSFGDVGTVRSKKRNHVVMSTEDGIDEEVVNAFNSAESVPLAPAPDGIEINTAEAEQRPRMTFPK